LASSRTQGKILFMTPSRLLDEALVLSRRQSGRAWVRILVGVATLFVVALVGAFIALSLVDWNKHADLAIAEVKEATGRDLRFTGKIDVGLLPPRLIVDGVSLSNAPWGSQHEMVTAKHVEIRAALLPLLIGDVRLKIEIVEPDVFLETDKKGLGNWMLARAAKEQKPGASSEPKRLPVDFDAVRITKATIQYRSGRTGKTRRFSFEDAYIRPKGISGREINVKASIDGIPLAIAATTDNPLIETLGMGELLGIDLRATTSGASLAAEGRFGFPATGPQMALKVLARVDDTRPLAKISGVHIPRLPPLELDGSISGANRAYVIERIKLSMGKSAAAGVIKATTSGARPKISANVAAPLIDLLEVLALQEPDTGTRSTNAGASRRVFSKGPLPLDALNAVDVEVDLNVDRLVLPPALLLEAVRGRIALSGGRLETRSLAMRMGGGDVTLAGVLDATGAQRAQLSVKANGQDVDLGKMMTDLGMSGLITGGQTELKAELRSTGGSPAALAAALEGQVRIVMGPARTKNRAIDRPSTAVITEVLNSVNPLRNTEPYTQIQCAVINVPIKNGVITVDRTAAFETDRVGVAMAGTVNLGDETLDLSIRPQAKKGLAASVGGLANLVKVKGTLANPEVGVDVAGAASTAAQIGIGVMTGGLSLLAKGLFDAATMEAPCETALRGGKAPADGASGGQTPEPPTSGGIGGFFERLLK